MKDSWSVKRYAANPPGPFNPNLVMYSVYPFTDLPPFKLHVPYHFVIVNTGKKLLQLYGMDLINFESDFPFLSLNAKNIMRAVRNIYVAWMKAKPDPKWVSGEDYDDEQNSATEQTRHHGGAGSDGSCQGRDAPSSGRSRNQALDAAAGPSGALTRQWHVSAESLAPWDSASCLEPLELVGEGNDEAESKPFVDEEDDEYEDDEFFTGLKQWASDVWTATRADSGSESEVTLVGGAVPPPLCRDVDAATLPTLPLLFVQ
jgi:hypothetical protein